MSVTIPFVQSVEGCLSGAISQHGLSPAELESWLSRMTPELARLQDDARLGRLELLTIVDEIADLAAARVALDRLCVDARTIVFLGTGGSSLGGQVFAQVAGWNIPGARTLSQVRHPRTRFYDNLDGDTFAGALVELDLATTRFVVTSKSGGTAETLAQLIAVLSATQAAGLGSQIPSLVLGVSEPDVVGRTNGLRDLCNHFSIPMLDHPTGIGGRFSCLSVVGMLPALSRGLDAGRIRAGAKAVVSALLAAKTPAEFGPALGAAVAVGLNKERGIATLVFMPYCDRLGRLSNWFVQLWAESLGKGGEGTSPVAAMGPLDQHSQLQLFMDGPRALYLTVLRTPTAGHGSVLDPTLAAIAGASYLGGKTIGDIVSAQALAVPEALAKVGRPVRTFDVASLNEEAIGALVMHFMLETILAGRVLGVDPFDQPGVELAKVLTRERLG